MTNPPKTSNPEAAKQVADQITAAERRDLIEALDNAADIVGTSTVMQWCLEWKTSDGD